MLSLEEIKGFVGFGADEVHFTTTAWERLYEEYILFQPMEMDYKAFVNLVIALENFTSSEAIRYFWKIIDYDNSGKLTASKIKYFYKDIYNSLIKSSYEAPKVENVIIEIYDILRCNEMDSATRKDVIQSQQGHTIISMLLDINGFWRYDNRESLIADNNDDK